MNRLVHFLGYTAAIVVVGILIMTATGRLSSTLGGMNHLAGQVAPSSSTQSTPVTCTPIVQPENKVKAYDVTVNKKCSDIADITTIAEVAAAKQWVIDQETCKDAQGNPINIGDCANPTFCQKNGNPAFVNGTPTCNAAKTPVGTTKCRVQGDCRTQPGAACQQACKDKPKTCCFTDADKTTIAGCFDTCAAGTTPGSTYTDGTCPSQCQPVNARCCKNTSVSPNTATCRAACTTGETNTGNFPIATCGTSCNVSSSSSNSPVPHCCKTKTGTPPTYSCNATCDTVTQDAVAIVGPCDVSTNCKDSSSSASPPPLVYCCRVNTSGAYGCQATACNASTQTAIAITGACNTATNCKNMGASSSM